MTAASQRPLQRARPSPPTLSLEQIAERVLQSPDAAKLLIAVVSRVDAARRSAKNDAGPTFRRDKLKATAKAAERLRQHVQDLVRLDLMSLADAFGRQSPRLLSDSDLMNPGSRAIDLPQDGRIIRSPLAALEEIDLLIERVVRFKHACEIIASRQKVRRGNTDTPYHVEAAIRLLAEVWQRSKGEPVTHNINEFQLLVSRTLAHCAPPAIPEEQISTGLRRHFERQAGEVGEAPRQER